MRVLMDMHVRLWWKVSEQTAIITSIKRRAQQRQIPGSARWQMPGGVSIPRKADFWIFLSEKSQIWDTPSVSRRQLPRTTPGILDNHTRFITNIISHLVDFHHESVRISLTVMSESVAFCHTKVRIYRSHQCQQTCSYPFYLQGKGVRVKRNRLDAYKSSCCIKTNATIIKRSNPLNVACHWPQLRIDDYEWKVYS
jgi:hypothetical protein